MKPYISIHQNKNDDPLNVDSQSFLRHGKARPVKGGVDAGLDPQFLRPDQRWFSFFAFNVVNPTIHNPIDQAFAGNFT